MHPSEKKPNPKAVLNIGIWTLALETKRMTVRNSREVRSSDTGDSGRGTLLRVEKHSMKMAVHSVEMVSNKLDRILLSVCIQGSRTSCTKTVPSNRTDVDGNIVPDIKTSYSIKQASELLARVLKIDAKTAIKAILSPLPEEQDETIADEIPVPAYVEA